MILFLFFVYLEFRVDSHRPELFIYPDSIEGSVIAPGHQQILGSLAKYSLKV